MTKTPLRQLRRHRVLSGLTLRDVSEQTGIDPGHLSRVERGLSTMTTAFLGRLVPVLELTPEDIAAVVEEETVS